MTDPAVGIFTPGNCANSPSGRPCRLAPESDAADETIELSRRQLRLRADGTEWLGVAETFTAAPGQPIRFTTVEVAGYLTRRAWYL
jgi:hypothetical protein